MAEEKPTQTTPEPRIGIEDNDTLQYVLEHVRGAMPSSISAPAYADDEA